MSLSSIEIKRRSIQKVQPQLPKKNNQRELSSNRTKHKFIDGPQHQLKDYKRKQLNNLNTSFKDQNKTLLSQKSIYKNQTENKHLTSTTTYNQTSIMDASRFLQDHHNTQSLSELLKTKNNSLINTGRSSIIETQQNKQRKPSQNQINKIKSEKRDSLEIDDQYQESSKKRSSYEVQNQSEDPYGQDQNFADYIYGGQEQDKFQNQKKSLINTKVKTYSSSTHLIKKPQNWRQQNRYQPKTQQEHRMQLQHFNKQRQFINLKREQQQIMKMLQQYRINKKSLLQQTNRKLQSKKMMQKFYKQKKQNKKRLQSDQNEIKELAVSHSNSLPLLIRPKKQIIIPQVQQLNNQKKDPLNNLIQKKLSIINNQKINNSNDYNKDYKMKISLSGGKLGFGSKQPRKLYEEQIAENQFENVQKLQKKLREKGIPFNPSHIRKSLLNQRVYTNYIQNQKTQENLPQTTTNTLKYLFPQKQLASNPIYKKYPL